MLCGIEASTDEIAGMGGTFLGGTEWVGGLRDMRIAAHEPNKEWIDEQVAASVDYIKKNVFAVHGL